MSGAVTSTLRLLRAPLLWAKSPPLFSVKLFPNPVRRRDDVSLFVLVRSGRQRSRRGRHRPRSPDHVRRFDAGGAGARLRRARPLEERAVVSGHTGAAAAATEVAEQCTGGERYWSVEKKIISFYFLDLFTILINIIRRSLRKWHYLIKKTCFFPR